MVQRGAGAGAGLPPQQKSHAWSAEASYCLPPGCVQVIYTLSFQNTSFDTISVSGISLLSLNALRIQLLSTWENTV